MQILLKQKPRRAFGRILGYAAYHSYGQIKMIEVSILPLTIQIYAFNFNYT